MTGSCVFEDVTKSISKSRGARQLHGHADTHAVLTDTHTLYNCSVDEKQMIYEAAAKPAAVDIFPLIFLRQ